MSQPTYTRTRRLPFGLTLERRRYEHRYPAVTERHPRRTVWQWSLSWDRK